MEILGEPLGYPSRAGLKLEKALQVFDVQVKGKTALDVGASTGGLQAACFRPGPGKFMRSMWGRISWCLNCVVIPVCCPGEN